MLSFHTALILILTVAYPLLLRDGRVNCEVYVESDLKETTTTSVDTSETTTNTQSTTESSDREDKKKTQSENELISDHNKAPKELKSTTTSSLPTKNDQKVSAPKFETSTATTRINSKKGLSDNVDDNTEHLDAIQLNSRNFGSYLSSGDIWLIEFYSPDCKHCMEFAPSYADIAKHYHSSNTNIKKKPNKKKKRNIKVGKVNGEIERALVARFGIEAYPSFYLIDGFNVYKFKELRLKKNLMTFVEGGYKKYVAMSFYTSPMGPLGIFQGTLLSVGHLSMDIFEWTQTTFGLSPLFVGIILFGIMFVGCFMMIVLLALIIPEKAKRD